MCKLTLLLFAGCLTLVTVQAAGLEFDVAVVRPSEPITAELVRAGRVNSGMTIEGGRVNIGRIPLRALLQVAYGVRDGQITGPDWLNAQPFDIAATMPQGATEAQVPEMLRALLVDRFKLTVHRETKDQPSYALVVAKGGIKAKEMAADAEAPSLLPPLDSSAPPLQSTVAPMGGSLVRMTRTPDGAVISGSKGAGIKISSGTKGMRMESPKITFEELATMLTELMNQRVVDQTETKGFYQIAIDISLEEIMSQLQSQAAPPGPPGQAPTPAPVAARPTNPIADAIVVGIQKMGLKLESRKAPTEMIIVDHLEKTPTEN